MKRHATSLYAAAVVLLTALLTACSTKKNTAGTRFWQSFVTRYNVYYNGHEAYKEGCEAKEKGNTDNYTEQIPLFTVGNEKSRTLGKGSFETAITKCEKAIQLHSIKRRPVVSASKRKSAKTKAYLKRQEFNPFLKNAWLLMGKAQFQKGEFLEAASTFAYITRHYAAEPLVATEARIWLARCYAEEEWFYDAEDALSRVGRDSVPPRLRNDLDASTADLLLRRGSTADAVPYLERVARHEKRKLQRARLYFLLGQVETSLGHDDRAYKAYAKCLRQSPPYEMAFNARIRQTEVIATAANRQKVLRRLRQMARSANNKDYLDQVYYAIGNIHLAAADTAAAIAAYEKGRSQATRSGVEKGVLLLRLGGVYWDVARYDLSQKCYTEAIGLISKDYPGYDDITRRSKVLDELVPYTSAVHLQDSLLALSVASEADRNAAIDRVIADLKAKEEAEARAKAEQEAESAAANGESGNNRSQQTTTPTRKTDNDGTWYFYNPVTVSQGKQTFQRQWGKRKNEDDWRRANKSVIAMETDGDYDYAAEDSIAEAGEAADTLAGNGGEAELDESQDPHKRAFYMAQIPFTEEAKAAAHDVIKDGLYNAGIIEKDKLEDFPLAAKTLIRLTDDYPDYEKCEDAFYQLFLLYSRLGNAAEAARYRDILASRYAGSDLARLVTDPDYEHNARYGKAIEDSLYTATYDAYRRRDNAAVERNFAVSTNKFPTGANRPKFIFVHALSRIGRDDAKSITEELRALVEKYPQSEVSEPAGLMVKGLESGRLLTSGGFDVGSLWSRRTAAATAAVDAAGKVRTLSADRDVPFLCLIAFPTDSLDGGHLLYDLAHFNFTGFKIRNFDIGVSTAEGLTMMQVAGFSSFDEAHAYAQQLFTDAPLAAQLVRTRLVLISQSNLELLGTTYSFDDYRAFYDKTFAPLKINPQLPLDIEEGPVEQHYEDEYTPDELEEQTGGGSTDDTDDDGGEWYTP